MKLSKVKIKAYVFDYCQEYVKETITLLGVGHCDREQVDEDTEHYCSRVEDATSVDELINITSELYRNRTIDAQGFFDAMVKVVPHIKNPKHKDDMDEDDRTWYRAWHAIAKNADYFDANDLLLSMGRAQDFLKHGAITQEQYSCYRLRNTLRMAATEKWMTNGRPDVSKILAYVPIENRERYLDLPLLYGISNGNDNLEQTLTVALLKFM